MLGCKRQGNGGNWSDRPNVKLIKDDAVSVYESTLHKLRAGWPPGMATSAASDGKSREVPSCLCNDAEMVGTPATTKEAACKRLGVSCSLRSLDRIDDYVSSCFQCRKKTCVRCRQQCTQCEEDFCPVCSIMDFSERYDRAFCLDCYFSAARQ